MRRRSTPPDLPRVPDELRCRRSNGKDWRCSEQALPDLSYCAYHHRLNYHRPPPGSGSRPSRRKGDLAGDGGEGGEGDVKRRRRRRRWKEDLICLQEMGTPIFQSSKDAALLNINGDDSCLSDPIHDAVPVRCRPNGESTITDLLSSNGLPQEMNTDELSISDTVFGAMPAVPDELRCKRSNGKEWRCTEQSLPNLSYCPYHHHLNYNRPPPSKARGTTTPRTSRTKNKQQQVHPENKVLCRRTNGKGWKCPNLAVDGLSYCLYHHQLNYRTGVNCMKVGTRKMVPIPEEQLQHTHELLLDGLHYAF